MMLYAIYLYFCCNSFTRASRALEPLVKRSSVAIWKWLQKLAPICDKFDVDRSIVSCIYIDETMVYIKGYQAWVWIAYEPIKKLFLAFHISYRCNTIDAYLFIQELIKRYGRKAICTDDADWYKEACRWLRLQHHVYPIEQKNLIERMNQVFKDRIECFDDLFPCFKEGCERRHVHNWISVFRFYYNYVRVNEEMGKAPLQDDTLPEYMGFITLIQEVIP
jgi:Transposase and inactivated derivatives